MNWLYVGMVVVVVGLKMKMDPLPPSWIMASMNALVNISIYSWKSPLAHMGCCLLPIITGRSTRMLDNTKLSETLANGA